MAGSGLVPGQTSRGSPHGPLPASGPRGQGPDRAQRAGARAASASGAGTGAVSTHRRVYWFRFERDERHEGLSDH